MNLLKQVYAMPGIILLIFMIVYAKHIVYGGPGLDDELSYLVQANNDTLSLSALIGPRPERFLYGLSQYVMAGVFKEKFFLYIIAQLSTWVITIAIINKFIKIIFDENVGRIFYLLSPHIIFASAIVYSPYKVGGYELSLLLWALHINILMSYLSKNRITLYYLSYIFLLLSLFALEYIIGLLVISIIFPVIYKMINKEEPTRNLHYLLVKFITPVIIVCISYFLFKVYISKLFFFTETQIYGFTPFSLKSLFQALYFFITILVEFPIMLIEVIPNLFKWKVFFLAFGVTLFYFYLLNEFNKRKANINYKTNDRFYVWMFLISLVSCSSIFLFSGYPSSTFGPYNKMMLPSFLIISILVSYCFSKMLTKSWMFIPTIISVLWISSMIIQVDNFVSAWKIRQLIMNDLKNQLQTVTLRENSILVANIPYFLKQNYNNEPVTYTTRAFKSHLKLIGAEEVLAFPICYRIITDRTFYPAHNFINYLSDMNENSNYLYYEYEEGSERGVLEQLFDKISLLEKFDEIKVNKINYHPIILREKIRLAFKKIPFIWNVYKRDVSEEIKQNI
jgi:hypothetical protein|tara:strand:- start:552 stop:2243 length:1692 start_codon:yes stop_codon:yes gene_type:complete